MVAVCMSGYQINMFKKVTMTYLCVLLVLLLMDGIWLGWLAKNLYQQQIGFIMRTDIPMWPWITFYLLYSASIVYLAISPAVNTVQSSFKGLVLGLTAYGVYNLTNYSLIENWPLSIALQDWMWGSFLTLVCATSGMQIWRRYHV